MRIPKDVHQKEKIDKFGLIECICGHAVLEHQDGMSVIGSVCNLCSCHRYCANRHDIIVEKKQTDLSTALSKFEQTEPKMKFKVMCEVEVKMSKSTKQNGVGIDLGLKSFAVTSNGERVESPRFFRKSEDKLAQLQHRLSRKQKNSNRRDKARLKVARIHEKIANQRADFLHKLSRRLVDENQAIYVEDLNVKGMQSNHHLAKSISDSGWGEFVRQLEYKGEWYNCPLGKIDRFFPSSKRHSTCGWINEGLTLADREWTCLGCGETVDRDLNAAQNILLFGKERSAGTAQTQRAGRLRVRNRVAEPRNRPRKGTVVHERALKGKSVRL